MGEVAALTHSHQHRELMKMNKTSKYVPTKERNRQKQTPMKQRYMIYQTGNSKYHQKDTKVRRTMDQQSEFQQRDRRF